ncbi:nitroreductase family deazaflavin-dependent oxidoreductase [Myceligenerans indicum]|uniref:nitroreductase family deazaflavin-dependent oxidoreductase n=1 Tax=Myceligenerans indicum TaxID=2593663 RepID=UPI00191DB028|nr:nitroreductase family deazaflavin-dependent oxidoreductase [Myceligenerans indicum]
MTSIRERWLWLLKNTLNRWTVKLARSGTGPFSLVRHVGRKSGATYETPIIVARAAEGFIAELTYGENVNWYRNIVAAGGCELVVDGAPHHVIAVEPYPSDAGRRAFPPPARLVLRLTGRHEYRLLRTVAADRTAR